MGSHTGRRHGMGASSKPCILLCATVNSLHPATRNEGTVSSKELPEYMCVKTRLAQRLPTTSGLYLILCRDGVFWAALWEARVDRADRIPAGKTDQWVQQERSVRLDALWLIGCTYENILDGWEVPTGWDTLMEAHPQGKQARQSPTLLDVLATPIESL